MCDAFSRDFFYQNLLLARVCASETEMQKRKKNLGKYYLWFMVVKDACKLFVALELNSFVTFSAINVDIQFII